ncbi:unnamed protein product [Cylicocyclus nassatus]|uniref:Uncharacterized protein n=1 Tax=Cylicocyclus nassatus TaxID=53992 RepID=A0AA36GSG1_CYLNA|nr:unnamed protein product [Cylicocyclus nassatus]
MKLYLSKKWAIGWLVNTELDRWISTGARARCPIRGRSGFFAKPSTAALADVFRGRLEIPIAELAEFRRFTSSRS